MSTTPKFFDRVMMDSTTTGTGTYTLGSAITGFRSFGSALSDGDTVFYCAQEVDASGNPSGGWEVGRGTYTAAGTTLSRDAVLASSNSNNAVSWAAGTRRIFLTIPAAYTPPTDGVFGTIMRGAQYRRVSQAVNTGDTDLYTVPTGKIALVGIMTGYNNSGVGNIVAFSQVKVAGTYYRLSTSATIASAAQGAISPATWLVAGDILAINTTTNNGLNITASVVEFDAGGPIAVGRVLGPSTGDNTLYTCPAGKNATLVSPLTTAMSSGAFVFVADAGGARTISINLVPSGGSPSSANKVTASVSVSASNRNAATALPACLGAGDFLSLNVDTGNAAQYAAVVMVEATED